MFKYYHFGVFFTTVALNFVFFYSAPMDLLEYIASEGLNGKEFADKIGLTPQSVYTYIRQTRIPSVITRKKIELATGGKVTFSDWPSKKK